MKIIRLNMTSGLFHFYTKSEIRQGENLASQLEIALSPDYVGDYTYNLKFKLNDDAVYLTESLTPQITDSEYIITYPIKNPVTAAPGTLKIELTASNASTGFLVKSAVANLKVIEAIEGANEIMPEAYVEWVTVVNQAVLTATEQARLAEAAAIEAARQASLVAAIVGEGFSQASSEQLGAVRAPARTFESIPVVIDTTTGNLYTSQSDLTYIHTQILASKDWTIMHSLQKYPSVTIIDSADSVVHGDIEYIDKMSVVLHFNAEFSGKAYLN